MWELAEYLLEHCKVVTTPRAGFGSCGWGYLRISYASSLESIEEGVRRIARGLKELRNGVSTRGLLGPEKTGFGIGFQGDSV